MKINPYLQLTPQISEYSLTIPEKKMQTGVNVNIGENATGVEKGIVAENLKASAVNPGNVRKGENLLAQLQRKIEEEPNMAIMAHSNIAYQSLLGMIG